MKFRDMENDSRYVMLNSKLKDTKKKLKTTTVKTKNTKKTHARNEKASKFAMKYQDRIASIKQSDEKAEQRKEQKIKQIQKREENSKKIQDKNVSSKLPKKKSTLKPKH